jgi:hypothetical protein
MLVVVEGADGSGKSTLISQLRRNAWRQYCVVVSASRPWDGVANHHQFVQAVTRLKSVIAPGHVICDRFHLISEAVYAPIIRGESPFGEDVPTNWGRELTGIDLIVHCRPSYATALANLEKNPQMRGVQESLVDLMGRYDQLMELLRLIKPYQRYNYEKDPLTTVTNRIFGE